MADETPRVNQGCLFSLDGRPTREEITVALPGHVRARAVHGVTATSVGICQPN